MFDSFKVYIYGIASVIVIGFLAVFKYRGSKIDTLERDVEIKVQEIAVAEKVSENKVKITSFEAANKVAREVADAKNKKEFDDNFPIGKRFFI